ncbi:hypothetical protein [Chryseobacterium gambrini]|uniref:hypothetical protein n=1 Tax=Chryseobacterium gambrini TaxID=373672 RepID=UPI003BA7BACE
MTWKVAERKIGKAGNIKQQQKRQQEWNRKYGENLHIGYFIHNEFIAQEDALEIIYYKSYEEHFENHPNDLQELIHTAKALRNPHAEMTGGTDLQVPAIYKYLKNKNLTLLGNEMVDIGTYGSRSHKLSVRLSPLTIKVTGNPNMTLEKFWQDKKCLVIWEDN